MLIRQGFGGAVGEIRAAVCVVDTRTSHRGHREGHGGDPGGGSRGHNRASWRRPGAALGFAALRDGRRRLDPSWSPNPGQWLRGPRARRPPGPRDGLGAARRPGSGARRRLVLRAGDYAAASGEATGRGRGPGRWRRLPGKARRARSRGSRGTARRWGGRGGPRVQVLEEGSGGRGCSVQPPPLGQRVQVVVAVMLARWLRLGVRGAAARGAVQRLHGPGGGRDPQLRQQMLRAAAAACSLPARPVITDPLPRPACTPRSRRPLPRTQPTRGSVSPRSGQRRSGPPWHSRRGRSHPLHRAIRELKRPPRPRTKTLVWRRAPGSRVPLPAHCQSAGDRQPRLLPGCSGGEKLLHARPPPSPARRARPASCQRAGEGAGQAGGGAAARGTRGTQIPGAHAPTPPRTTLCLFAFGCTGATTQSRLGREEAGVKGGKRAGIGHLGTLQVQAG